MNIISHNKQCECFLQPDRADNQTAKLHAMTIGFEFIQNIKENKTATEMFY